MRPLLVADEQLPSAVVLLQDPERAHGGTVVYRARIPPFPAWADIELQLCAAGAVAERELLREV